MDKKAFRQHAHELVDWMADYLENVDQYPPKSQVAPGDILKQLPPSPPNQGEAFKQIMADFEQVIIPGMTHWQHPKFFAYFPCNTSPPSILAEMLTATMNAQCMSWQTSPAATELEERVMEWLRDMIGLPSTFDGVIQDTASTATLCSLLTAREKASNYQIKTQGFTHNNYTLYCSDQTHSSIDKAVRIAGFGTNHLRKIPTDEHFALKPEVLEQAIQKDLDEGKKPLWVCATLGTTSSTAVDPIKAIAEICNHHNLWCHVDAAYGGSAMILPELQHLNEGADLADSYVFNPHKWLLTNFDCSVYFVKDKDALINTFSILPEYLKTKEGTQVNNYRDWGIQLGRRFRALKLWFVIRSYGVEGLQALLRGHIALAKDLAKQIDAHPNFELLALGHFNLVCFRYKPENVQDEATLEQLNNTLMESLNTSGALYLTHTKLNGLFTLRLAIGQTFVTKTHVDEAWKAIQAAAEKL